MRILRLGEGWSAERLSQEYAEVGPGTLTRTTIAKIEGGTRRIKLGEVEGVARVFGLTPADLSSSGGQKVFLSYAQQDRDIGQEISAWLALAGFQVLSADRPAGGEPAPGSAAGPVIDSAHAFVMVLTPSFLSSPRCREELDLAGRREQQQAAAGRPGGFIHVLQVPDWPEPDRSDLPAHILIDLSLAGARSREAALSSLGSSIILRTRGPAAQAHQPGQVQVSEEPLNRGEELEHLLFALRSPSGKHFWLVIGPPGVGKSWLLRQLGPAAAQSGGWIPSLVDLATRGEAGEGTGRLPDAAEIIRELLGPERADSSGPADDVAIAEDIISGGQSRLCLLDGAERLPAGTIAELRKRLGNIYRLIQGTAGARLAFVVASRRDDDWGGLIPRPRLSVLPLAGFGSSAIFDALEQLAGVKPLMRSRKELREDAALVERTTEGMPDLVKESLEWIQAVHWLEIGRLETLGFLSDYVSRRLLAGDILLPGDESQAGRQAQLAVMLSALEALAPYRFITLAHVRHYQDDAPLRDALKEAGWSAEELWQALSNMALLRRPLAEPWLEIHPGVRRLLFRHFYRDTAQGAEAHARAREFSAKWARAAMGKDQVVGMVEVLWHETARLRLTALPAMADQLPRFASKLPGNIRESGYQRAELRDYAVQRMEADDELQREVADVEDLFDKLILAIEAPAAWEDLK
jgi:hypothetical protein